MYKTSNNYKKQIYADSSNSMLKIYINDKLINEDYIVDLSLEDNCFENDTFTLGSTIIQKVELKLDNLCLPCKPEEVKKVKIDYGLNVYSNDFLKYKNDNIKYLNELLSITNEDLFDEEWIPIGIYDIAVDPNTSSSDYTTFTLYDYMNRFDFYYDASQIIPCTRYELVKDMCKQVGIELGSSSFLNGNIMVYSYDNTIKAKDYLSFISERAGGFAKVGRNGKLYIKSFKDVDVIDIDDVISEMAVIEDKDQLKTITKVIYENALQKFEDGTDEGLTIRLSSDNLFTMSEDEFKNIFNALNGLSFQSADIKIWGDPSCDTGDIINIAGIRTFIQPKWSYNNGFYGNYKSTLKETAVSSNVTRISNKTKIKKLDIKLQEVTGEVDIISKEIDDQNSKISEIKLNTDEILSKVQRDLTLKKDVTGFNNITVEDAKLGNVLSFDLYGSVKSTDNYTNLVIEDSDGNKRNTELPFNELNYLDKDTYDEFVVENNSAKIIRRTEYSTVYNAIEIGDDLSGTRLKLNLYDFQQGNFDLLVTDNYRIRVRSWLNSDGSRNEVTILENANQTDSVVLYEYNSSTGEKIKIPYYKLPSDFGIVTEIWDNDVDNTLSNVMTYEAGSALVKSSEEKIEDLGECFITLNDGYNKIYLETSNINYKMSYVIKNDYTDVLATQIDLSTTRSQTEKSIIDKVYGKYTDSQGNIHEISSELENKIDKDDDGSLISMINASANVINLNSNRFSMTSDNSKISQDGSVEFLSGLIGGWHIDKNKLWCSIVPEYDYSESDYNRLREILNGSSYSNEEFQKYDIDKSGSLDSKDLLMCRQLIYFNLQKSNPGKLLLDTTDWVKPIKIVNSSGEVIAWFGIRGVGTKDMG